MRGFPKHLNTRSDYEHMLALMPEETKAELKKHFDARFSWFPVKKLKDSENPKETDTKQIRLLPVDAMGAGDEPQMERWLFELKEDQNAWFFRIGFTVEEAESIINS